MEIFLFLLEETEELELETDEVLLAGFSRVEVACSALDDTLFVLAGGSGMPTGPVNFTPTPLPA